MPLTDILTNSGNVSAIIEVFTLFFIVAGFFRWYDGKYQKTITSTREEVIDKLHEMNTIICERLTRIDNEIIRLDNRLHKHIVDQKTTRRSHDNSEEENETY